MGSDLAFSILDFGIYTGVKIDGRCESKWDPIWHFPF